MPDTSKPNSPMVGLGRAGAGAAGGALASAVGVGAGGGGLAGLLAQAAPTRALRARGSRTLFIATSIPGGGQRVTRHFPATNGGIMTVVLPLVALVATSTPAKIGRAHV
jgi:hypothetical protein